MDSILTQILSLPIPSHACSLLSSRRLLISSLVKPLCCKFFTIKNHSWEKGIVGKLLSNSSSGTMPWKYTHMFPQRQHLFLHVFYQRTISLTVVWPSDRTCE